MCIAGPSNIMPCPHQKPTKTNSSLQVKTKNSSRAAQNHEKISENFYPTFKNLTEAFSIVMNGVVEDLLGLLLINKTIRRAKFPNLL